MQKHFETSAIVERAQALYFSRRFGVRFAHLPQGPGICGDYEILETSYQTRELEKKLGFPLLGRYIEFKNDKTSLQYNSFYVEFEQTSDFWYSRKPSGHELASTKGCVLIISSGSRCFVFNRGAYIEFVKGVTRVATTKYCSNGNPPGCFTRGKIVPIDRAMETASFLYNMSQEPSA